MILSRQRRRSGFTIIEMMIVLAIIAIMMTASVPMIWKAMAKDDLARAVKDVMEGCKTARERAILNGSPYEFVITKEGDMTIGSVSQAKTPSPDTATEAAEAIEAPKTQPSGSLMAGFPRKLGQEVAIQLIDVNFVDHMAVHESHVHFYPNGTSDEFTIVLNWKGEQKTVTLDVVTGLPDLLVLK
jgi:type II secretion system protein H